MCVCVFENVYEYVNMCEVVYLSEQRVTVSVFVCLHIRELEYV